MPEKSSGRSLAWAILAATWVFMSYAGSAHGEWLVTPEEVARFHDEFDAPLWVPKAVEGPVIEVLRPTLIDGRISSPTAIELFFSVGPDAAIDAGSFRVYYGALKLDITQRLLKSVKVRVDGLYVDQAEIPAGNHRFVLQVSDTKQRTATRDLRFVIQ